MVIFLASTYDYHEQKYRKWLKRVQCKYSLVHDAVRCLFKYTNTETKTSN